MIVLRFMPVGQMPRWIQVEQKIEQLKDVIHNCMEKDHCIPTEISVEYNKLIEEKRNFDAEAERLRKEAEENSSFKERVLNLLQNRLNFCEQEHAHPTVKNQYAFLYNTISKWKEKKVS